MKNVIFVVLAVSLMSCGVNTSLVSNSFNSNTEIQLSQQNFRILNKVTGTSSNSYMLGIGGLSNKALINNAKSKMINNANLNGS